MRTSTLLRCFAGAAILFLFNSCLKDHCTRTYTFYSPIYRTTAEVRANIKSADPKPLEQTGKLFIIGKYILLNEPDKGIHVFDNSNPSSPKNISFIAIPGNMDMAVKGTTLYADLYTDLVAIDISDPLNAKVKSVSENAFPHRLYSGGFSPDKEKIIVDWEERDTTVDMDCSGGFNWGGCPNCAFLSEANVSAGGDKSFSSPFGTGGSMARFTIINSTLYTVSDNALKVFSLSAPEKPAYVTNVDIGWGIETIYPFRDKLFIGSNSGMFIFDASNPMQPQKQGQFQHVRSCDPVIADDKYAYVTLRSGTSCQGFTNQMEVVDVQNVLNPSLVKTYPMSNPHGLSKDGNTLFICDGKEGLRILKANDVQNITQLQQIKGPETYDVIAWNGVAIVSARDGLYQYDYSDLNNVKLLSRISYDK
jgi:hypothetical protein